MRPLGPGLQALLVHPGNPPGGLFAEEHAQRRLLGVDDLEDRAADTLGAGRLGGGAHLGQCPVEGPVGVLTMRGEDRRAREVGCEGAGFDHRDLDAEGRDFLGEGLAHPFQRPLGGAVAAGAAEGVVANCATSHSEAGFLLLCWPDMAFYIVCYFEGAPNDFLMSQV